MDNNTILEQMISINKFGTFFGVKQEVLETVWNSLTAPEGNSVTYVSMEIGADNDVLNPVKNKLEQLPFSSGDSRLKYFTSKFLHDSGKIPNYSGGLGVLAGDTLKSFADCTIPVVAISLLYRKGYFSQLIDSRAGQIAYSTQWRPEETSNLYLLKDPVNPDIPLQIEIPFFERGDKKVSAYANLWVKMEINSTLDFFVPEILLDYSISPSPSWICMAAEHLYDSRSERSKIIQRRLLGAGVIPVMQALGITSNTIHLNEQHGVVVVLHLIADYLQHKFGVDYPILAEDKDILDAANKAAERMVYTIHTPVKAGHDRFSKDLYSELGHSFCQRILGLLAQDEDNSDLFNFTNLAMKVNRASNSVSRIHQQVTQKQFPKYAHKIKAVTNGVHHLTWISKAKAELYDSFKEFHHWRLDPGVFANASQLQENNKFRTYLEQAWLTDTTLLTTYINQMLIQHRNQMHETWIDPPNFISHLDEKSRDLNPNIFTIGFARRFSTYKRADLIFDNIDILAKIVVEHNWPVNFVFAGKAHPSDEPGKSIIKLLLDRQQELYEKSKGLAKLIFIPGYDMAIAKLMVAGVHSWLNTPKRPLEASGTSGMKAAINGIPNISIMDGWWVEGYHDGKTGWKFGAETIVTESCLSEDAACLLYEEDSTSFYKVFPQILQAFYDKSLRSQFIDKCINNIALNGPIFNTHRLAAEYVNLYKLPLPAPVTKKIHRLASLYDSNR
ncbi:MAG: alpha-glucan family phosphorylase [Proteobacteria bacterium]|nr:alpha-glucan family phosphorylase [Desulfobulbaceae bacterium]MBU4152943.1 alpha-glucan family phosphorylase [Pseudomonadota bacterium]